jgi:hypothetical protein
MPSSIKAVLEGCISINLAPDLHRAAFTPGIAQREIGESSGGIQECCSFLSLRFVYFMPKMNQARKRTSGAGFFELNDRGEPETGKACTFLSLFTAADDVEAK